MTSKKKGGEKQFFEKIYKEYLLTEISKLKTPFKNIWSEIYRPGKRVRSHLIEFGYTLFTSKKIGGELRQLQIAYELLHTYAKLKDDVVDIHLNSEKNKNILAQKILIADLAYYLSQKAFFTLPTPLINLLKEDWLYLQAITWKGEFEEVSRKHPNPENVALLKTAYYTFTFPMMMGAKMAEDKEMLKKLPLITKKMGIAFQIQNDLTSYKNKNLVSEDLLNKRINGLMKRILGSEKEIQKYYKSPINLTKDRLLALQRKILLSKEFQEERGRAITLIESAKRDIIKLRARPHVRRQFLLYIDNVFSELRND
ncbi:MAG: class 1 isoprenoid biosynthesis enzyme [Anaplasmataceae bacterium]|nr:class 1 isoprenoid biosynthesis enzyme [Anaplasmataceae bacterium]